MYGYLNPKDLTTFLDRSIVKYDNDIGFVNTEGAMDGYTIMFHPITGDNRKPKLVKITDDKFSCRNIDFGYMQFDNTAVFVRRKPVRVFKQGIVINHLMFTPNIAGRDTLHTTKFADCIRGKHLTFRQAMNKINGLVDNRGSYAFHRNFCVSKEGNRYYIKFMDNPIATRYDNSIDWTMIANGPFKKRIAEILLQSGGPNVDV